jgi:hypothetical protein
MRQSRNALFLVTLVPSLWRAWFDGIDQRTPTTDTTSPNRRAALRAPTILYSRAIVYASALLRDFKSRLDPTTQISMMTTEEGKEVDAQRERGTERKRTG